VLLVTGTPGAGKSTVINLILKINPDLATIYEGQLANFSSAKMKIDQVFSQGLKPEIMVIHTTPELALDNALRRFDQVGRGASIGLIAELLVHIPKGLNEVHQEYGERVKFNIVNQTNPAQRELLSDWQNLPLLNSLGNHDTILERLANHLEQRYQSGTIDQANYEQARGRAPRRLHSDFGQNSDRGIEPNGSRSRVSQSDRGGQLLTPSPAPKQTST
jgi:hypothetical protein